MTKKDQGICSHPRCTNDAHAQGRCRSHYRAIRAAQAKPCKRARCTSPRHAKGLCRDHYAKVQRKAARAARLNPRRSS